MRLKILLPSGIYAEEFGVLQIIVETEEGSFGILPNRLDCVGVLVPGILTFQTAEEENYLAIDRGVFIKAEDQVLLSVRSVIGGKELGELNKAVEQEFLQISERELEIRTSMLKLETGFIRQFQKLKNI